jgi:zinc protease
MVDRSKQPAINPIQEIEFIRPKIYDVNDHVKLFFVKEVSNETARLELYFDAGLTKGEKGISSFVNGMLLSGNAEQTSTDVRQAMDILGGFYESGVSMESAAISLYGLREHFPKLVHLLHDAIDTVSMEENELSEMLADKKQQFEVNMQKTRYLAQREFQQKLFNDDAEYGKVAQPEFYDNVSRRDLQRFFQKHYQNGLTKIALVGNFEQDFVDEIIDTFGGWCAPSITKSREDLTNKIGHFIVKKEGALQSSIRVGRMLFNKKHPDFIDFQILNTILGDYFGSRLMTNIREDKGYTYGIGTMMAELDEIGYFLIATEVGKEVCDATIKEIKFEIDKLRNELVGEEELGLVKNYLLGNLLKSADGPYATMDLYMNVNLHDMDLDFYNKAIDGIKNIKPERIKELANKYLVWDEMTIVTAG